jgi:hypothetical protein
VKKSSTPAGTGGNESRGDNSKSVLTAYKDFATSDNAATAIMADILTAATGYAARGWIVHRIHPASAKVNSPGKQPIDTGWQKVMKPATEEKLKQWFGDANPKGYNIGLLCGEASGITVIDLDRMIYADIFNGVGTLRSSRTDGRGHVFFKYNPRLKASKHHNIGIEVLATGNNVILPPSIHISGDVYKWDDPAAPLIEMPEEIEARLTNLFKREKELNALIRKCRPCFKRLFKTEVRKDTEFHGAEGRELMLAWGAELKAAGATLADAEMWARIIYGDGFDIEKTVTEWRHIDEKKTWKCATVADKLGGVIECDCVGCKWKTPTAPASAQPAEGARGTTFRVINDVLFTSMRNVAEGLDIREVSICGEDAFRTDAKEFVKNCLAVKAIELIEAGAAEERIITHPEEIIPLIEKVEQYKGESGVINVYIDGCKNEFSRKEIHKTERWKDVLFNCKYAAVISLHSNRDKMGFAKLLRHIINMSEIKWVDDSTVGSAGADRIMSEIRKKVVTYDQTLFIGTDMARLYTKRNGVDVMYVKSDSIERIKEQIGMRHVLLSKINQMLAEAGYLLSNAVSIDKGHSNTRVWVFKPLEGGEGVEGSK